MLRIGLLLGSVAIALLCSEIALRLINFPKIPRSGWRTERERGDVNEIGFRGRRIQYGEQDLVVLLVGDSNVECDACPSDALPEILLERALRREAPHSRVFSLGAAGWGQDQQLLALEKYFSRYRADLVVLWQTPRNDLWNNVFPTHWPGSNDGTPKPTFRLARGRLVGPSEGMGDPVHRSRIAALLVAALFGGRDAYWERFLPEPFAARKTSAGLVTVPPPDAAENLVTEKAHVAHLLTPSSPRQRYAMDLTRALLERIESLASSYGAALAIFEVDEDTEVERSYPVSYRYPPGLFAFEVDGRFYPASLQQGRINWDYVHAGFRRYRIPVTEPDYRVSRRDPHLSVRGNRQVLDDLADVLWRTGVLGGRASGAQLAPEPAPIRYGPQGHAAAPYVLDMMLDLRDAASSDPYLGEGWDRADPAGAWTVGPRATVRLDLREDLRSDILLATRVEPFLPPDRAELGVAISANGQIVEKRGFGPGDAGPSSWRTLIRAERAGGAGRLDLDFLVDDPVSPAQLGLSSDARRLGIRVESLRLVSVDRLRVGTAVDFSSPIEVAPYLGTGWSYAEDGGRWTQGERATLLLDPQPRPSDGLAMVLRVTPHLPDPGAELEIAVSINRSLHALWRFGRDDFPATERRVEIPASLIGERGAVEVTSTSRTPDPRPSWVSLRIAGAWVSL